MSAKKKSKHERIAVIPVTKDKKKLKVYLVTSRKKHKWIIPTGKLERKHSNREVALLEAFEEAGILGKLDKHFKVEGSEQQGKHSKELTVFLLHVKRELKRWPEFKERKRKKVDLKKYLNSIRNKKVREKVRKKVRKKMKKK